jgi:hypothetical protein
MNTSVVLITSVINRQHVAIHFIGQLSTKPYCTCVCSCAFVSLRVCIYKYSVTEILQRASD